MSEEKFSELKFSAWDQDSIVNTALREIKNENKTLSLHVWQTVLTDFLGEQGEFWDLKDDSVVLKKSENEIAEKVKEVVQNSNDDLTQFSIQLRQIWEQFNRENIVFKSLNDFFCEDLNRKEIFVRVWPSRLCPYQKDGFCVSVKSSTYAIKMCVHELIHLYWWQVWDKNINVIDKEGWMLSEMAVETVKRNSSLNELVDDQLREESQIALKAFYSMKVGDKNLFECLDEICQKVDYKVVDFMTEAYSFVKENFDEINAKYYKFEFDSREDLVESENER